MPISLTSSARLPAGYTTVHGRTAHQREDNSFSEDLGYEKELKLSYSLLTLALCLYTLFPLGLLGTAAGLLFARLAGQDSLVGMGIGVVVGSAVSYCQLLRDSQEKAG